MCDRKKKRRRRRRRRKRRRKRPIGTVQMISLGGQFEWR
jgi:hypothetical protein